MLTTLVLPGGTYCESLAGNSLALGVARRWPLQHIGAIPDVRVALDADLCSSRELAEALAKEGVQTAGLSLAQLLAHLYALRGLEFVNDLDGAFAVAVWDEKARRLSLAIDRLGVKGLYWRQDGDQLRFASRASALCADRDQPPDVDLAALMQYLLLSVVPAPRTIFRGMEKLCPGSVLIYESGQIRRRRYWDLEYPEDEQHDERYWAQEVREGIRSAVHRHLEGCDPARTGAYLSGGTDSSSVVAFMNECTFPVNTFSVFFAESFYSEIGFARAVAEHFGTRCFERLLTAHDAVEVIPKLIQYYDEPFANSSAIGAYYCARLAGEHGIETLLAGDGGDELFAGNEHYAFDKRFALYQSVPSWLRRGFIEPLARCLPSVKGPLSLPRRYLRRARIANPRRVRSYNIFLTMNPEEIFDPGFLSQVPPETWMEMIEAHFRGAHARSELNRLLYLDLKVILADNDLRKVAGTAELAGVRVRFPLLDHRLAELSGRIPVALKLKGFQKRYIFKRAMSGILPHCVLKKKKHGFAVPLAFWLLQDRRLDRLVRDVLTDPRTRQRGYFCPSFLDQLMQLHRGENPRDYGEAIWHLVALELWHRHHAARSRSIDFPDVREGFATINLCGHRESQVKRSPQPLSGGLQPRESAGEKMLLVAPE
jgi:asparagine synthase (glutamine-hydrolysing)